MRSSATNLNLGPREVGTESTEVFILSREEWLGIQSFVRASLELPITVTELADKLPSKPTGGVDQYQNLVDAYKELNTSCKDYEDVVLPATIQCAADIIAYNVTVPAAYKRMKTEFDKINDGEIDEATGKKNIKKICELLLKKSRDFEKNAGDLIVKVKGFAEKTVTNDKAVKRQNDYYADKLSGKEGSITKMTEQLERERNLIKELEKEYEHDVIVAATTATYVFAWPFGTIAAGIVAGIYGDKAVKIKAQIEAFQQSVDRLTGALKADTVIALDLARVKQDIEGIAGKIATAMPTIQKIRGMWEHIGESLNTLSKILSDNTDDMEEIEADIAIDASIEEWKKLSKKALDYRINAYIKVEPQSQMAKVIRSGKALERKLKLVHSAK